MKFGLTNEQYEQLFKLVLNPLKELGATVYIFGSRAREKNHPFSDIDILFVPPKGTQINQAVFAIKEQIEESNFPIKVDLVDFNDLAKSYAEGVLKDCILIA